MSIKASLRQESTSTDFRSSSHTSALLGSGARRLRAWSTAAVAALTQVIGAFGQAPPVLNTPYQCANGITYTVTACKPYGADQWCETVEKQNGNLVTTMDSAWSSMTGRLTGCTIAAPSTSSTTKTFGAQQPQPSGGTQQALNPPYLKEFPSVDQIMTQLRGSSAQDTAYRQLTALHELAQMIAALAGQRTAQNQLTPDEARIITSYYNAYTNLANSTTNPQDAYASSSQFTASLFTTFNMPTIQKLWQNADTMSGQPTGDNAPRPLPTTNDPSQIAMRRCFELGGSALQCVSSGMGEGLKQFMGIDLSALTGSAKPGLIILGTYTASSGLFFAFDDRGVNIGSCGQMVQGTHSYSVSASGGKYAINIANQPQALLLTLGSDGKASGPASQDITGQKITGYDVTTNIKTGVVVSKTPIYAPITVHCSVGSLTPGSALAVDPGLPSSAPTMLSALGTVLDTMSGNTPQQLMLPPGPRMAGVFTGAGGMKIQFNDGSAIVDCAQAHILTPYSVSFQAGNAIVTVNNGSNPFKLVVQADGKLSGSGTTTVNGKLMTALSGADPVFAPTSASCPLNTLTEAK
jgi:hypothetical protein